MVVGHWKPSIRFLDGDLPDKREAAGVAVLGHLLLI